MLPLSIQYQVGNKVYQINKERTGYENVAKRCQDNNNKELVNISRTEDMKNALDAWKNDVDKSANIFVTASKRDTPLNINME